MLTMLTPEQIANIKAEIADLEKALAECNDTGLRKQIEAWIADKKRKLSAKDSKQL